MRGRLASIAFLLACVSVGIAWLTLQPALLALFDALKRSNMSQAPVLGTIRATLPLYLGLDLLVVFALSSWVLHLAVGRALQKTERAIENLASLEGEGFRPTGGSLLSRLERALERSAKALMEEQKVTRGQLEALKKAQTELVASERLATVGRLAAGVAHEVGNPLSGILGYLALASARAGTPELQDLLGRAETEVQRIDRIVRSLLELGRPPQGELSAVFVEPVLRSCIELASKGTEFSNVRIEIHAEPNVAARAESGPLAQILLNLLLNAAQAMNGQGKIDIRVGIHDRRVMIEVQDEGPGLSSHAAARLFEPFFTSKGKKGTGLGLAVSRHLALTMGGSLTAKSIQEKGAHFVLELATV